MVRQMRHSGTAGKWKSAAAALVAGIMTFACSAGPATAQVAQNAADNPALSGATDSGRHGAGILEQLSHESQAFYGTLQNSFVTVEMDPNPLHLLPEKIQKKFLLWEKNWVVEHDFRANPNAHREGPSEPRIVIKPDLRSAGNKKLVLNHSQQERLGDINHHAVAEIFLIRHYLFETHPLPPQEFWPEIKLINARLASLPTHSGNTVRGLIVGERGYIVIPAVIAPADDTRPVTIWNSQGKKYSAYILGVKEAMGVTVLAIKGHPKLHGVRLIRHPLHPAELLFAVSATSASAHWIMPLGGKPKSFPHSGRHDTDHGPGMSGLMGKSSAFVFNLRGHLAALNLQSGFFPLNNNRRALKSFLLTGSPQPPRFGIRFAMIKANDPLRTRIADLGHKPAMKVTGTFPNSPAARAGVKKGDIIIAIDGSSILDFHAIHRHIMANPKNVVLTILRHGTNVHISMSLRFGRKRAEHADKARKP